MINTIHRMYDTGGKGISPSAATSSISVPPGAWRKMPSYSNSPVVMVIVLRSARAGVENGVR